MNDNKEYVKEVTDAISLEISQFLEMLIHFVDLKAINAVEFLKELRVESGALQEGYGKFILTQVRF